MVSGLIALSVSLGLGGPTPALAQQASEPTVITSGSSPKSAAAADYVDLPLEHVYIPKGFDSNDNVQIVVRGTLPNLCYRAPKVAARRYQGVSPDSSDDRIFIKAFAQKLKDQTICAEMQVPFLEAVSIGSMDRGNYPVIVNPGTDLEIEATVQIEDAPKQTVDNHVYARVDTIDKRIVDGEIILRGYNPSDCFEFDRIEFVPNSVKPSPKGSDRTALGSAADEPMTDTYAVLPILKQVSQFCPRKMTEFEIRAKVPKDYQKHPLMKNRPVLLHIRVMDGRSMNTIFGEEEF